MSVSIRQFLIPASKYSIKSPYSMVPKGLVFHNTAGTASAMQEASAKNGNSLQSSIHLFVDETEAVQCLPFNRNSWHAHDGGNGYANRNLISVEVCRSKSALAVFKKAETNSFEICARVLLQLGLPANSNTIRWHREFAATACPHRTAELGDRNRVIEAIQEQMIALGRPEQPEGGVEYMKVLKIIGEAKGINVQGFGDFNTSAVAANNLKDGIYAVNAANVSNAEGYNWCVIYYPPLSRTLAMPYGGALSDRCSLLENQEPMHVIPAILQQSGINDSEVTQAELLAALNKAATAEEKLQKSNQELEDAKEKLKESDTLIKSAQDTMTKIINHGL